MEFIKIKVFFNIEIITINVNKYRRAKRKAKKKNY